MNWSTICQLAATICEPIYIKGIARVSFTKSSPAFQVLTSERLSDSDCVRVPPPLFQLRKELIRRYTDRYVSAFTGRLKKLEPHRPHWLAHNNKQKTKFLMNAPCLARPCQEENSWMIPHKQHSYSLNDRTIFSLKERCCGRNMYPGSRKPSLGPDNGCREPEVGHIHH